MGQVAFVVKNTMLHSFYLVRAQTPINAITHEPVELIYEIKAFQFEIVAVSTYKTSKLVSPSNTPLLTLCKRFHPKSLKQTNQTDFQFQNGPVPDKMF